MREYTHYIARRKAIFKAVTGKMVCIGTGKKLEAKDGFLQWKGKPLCAVTSKNAHDHFVQNDDGCGVSRGLLVSAICRRLEHRDQDYQNRWNRVWQDAVCGKYRRADHEDFWLWNHDFYNAPMYDLWHIAGLIGA